MIESVKGDADADESWMRDVDAKRDAVMVRCGI